MPNDVRPRAVLDTHVWLDWLAFEDPAVAPLRAAVEGGSLTPVASTRLRDELADVLSRPALRAAVHAARARRALPAPAPEPAQALARFDALARLVDACPRCELECADRDDQPFLDVAVAAGARWLITRDRDLLALARRARRRYGLAIVPPSGFAPAGPGRSDPHL